jgi:phosphatidylethanolamine/phosphatidyl-N-methylethanolamine N-methyltransferase
MNSGFVGKIFRFSHIQMEKYFGKGQFYGSILELGATDAHHFAYVRHDFTEYLMTDIDLTSLNRLDSETLDHRIKILALDASDLSQFPDESFDRVIATCLILHMKDPEKSLLEWQRVCKKGGFLSIYVHSEPGLLLRVGRYFTTNKKMKRQGLSHLDFVYDEHKIHYLAVKHLIRRVFSNDIIKSKSFPINLPWNLSLWKIFTIQKLESN